MEAKHLDASHPQPEGYFRVKWQHSGGHWQRLMSKHVQWWVTL